MILVATEDFRGQVCIGQPITHNPFVDKLASSAFARKAFSFSFFSLHHSQHRNWRDVHTATHNRRDSSMATSPTTTYVRKG